MRFFDCFLKGEDNGMRERAPVRLEVRANGKEPCAVRGERSWPLAAVRWTELHLAPGELREAPLAARTTVRFGGPDGQATFVLPLVDDTEPAGPMKLRLHVELIGAEEPDGNRVLHLGGSHDAYLLAPRTA